MIANPSACPLARRFGFVLLKRIEPVPEVLFLFHRWLRLLLGYWFAGLLRRLRNWRRVGLNESFTHGFRLVRDRRLDNGTLPLDNV
jgi:hypothetical protein